jgi:integrase
VNIAHRRHHRLDIADRTPHRGVGQAKRIRGAAPDLATKVRNGDMPIDRADRIIRDREAEQHRFASRAYRGTRNLRAVQTLLGDASIATTERYTAVDDDEIRAAAACAW